MATSIEPSGADAADSCSAWRHILLSLDQCLCRRASEGNKPWVSWHGYSKLPFCRVSFNSAAISACEKSAMAAGFESLAEMQQTIVLPGVICYSAVIGACKKGLRWRQV